MVVVSVVTVVHEVFGAVAFDPAGDSNRWESQTELAGGVVRLDMTFGGTAIGGGALDDLARYITDLAAFDRRARRAISAGLAGQHPAVRLYADHHIAEPGLPREIPGAGDGSVTPEVLLGALRLVRVGLYHGTSWSRDGAVFDYSIDPDFTQYLLVITFAGEGEVRGISMES